MEPINIQSAAPSQAKRLTELALRSKSHWGYSPEFMAACREELTVTTEAIKGGVLTYRVAVSNDNEVLGFYALESTAASTLELEALFIEPAHMGLGLGGRLLADAVALAKASGAQRVLIHSDPNATDFYLAAGAKQIGVTASGSIPGRDIPLLEIELDMT